MSERKCKRSKLHNRNGEHEQPDNAYGSDFYQLLILWICSIIGGIRRKSASSPTMTSELDIKPSPRTRLIEYVAFTANEWRRNLYTWVLLPVCCLHLSALKGSSLTMFDRHPTNWSWRFVLFTLRRTPTELLHQEHFRSDGPLPHNTWTWAVDASQE